MDRDRLSLQLVSALLARYCPSCPGAAVVDENLTVFLVRGPFNPPELVASATRSYPTLDTAGGSVGTLRDAISRVKQEQAPVTIYGVDVGGDGRSRACDVVVLPFAAAELATDLFLVLFEEPSLRRAHPISEQAITHWLSSEDSNSLSRRPRPLDLPGRTRDYAELRGLRILIVDDDPPTLDAIVEVLTISGAVVRGESSSASATRALDQFAPQVVISDIAMPIQDGYSFIRGLRARSAEQCGDIPALALTALDSEEDRRRALTAGYQMHMSKPVDIDRLRDAVVELLGMQVNATGEPS
jgi:CheY-like chemotaxis protein